MDINNIISLLKDFGYPFLFLWSILEGEIGLMLAGWLSSDNIFQIQKVIFIAISGAMIGDVIVFMIGRFYKQKTLNWLNKNQQKKDKILKLIDKYGIFLIFFERFIYGTHIPVLLSLGISDYKFSKWLIFDIIGVILWAVSFISIGYFFGNEVIDTILLLQKQILIFIIVIFSIIILKKGYF